MAVMPVDGVNVVTGETATPQQSGYVFAPWQTYDIAGRRKSQNEIAAFYFTALSDSYAARTDRPQNVGVIGVAVFRVYVAPRPRPAPSVAPGSLDGSAAPSDARGDTSSAADAPSRPSAAGAGASQSGRADGSASALAQGAEATSPRREARERIGTGHGEREASQVSYTDFRRASSSANEFLAIHYDRYENLVARGIIPGVPRLAEPQPFPGPVRFVPDPRG
ncbi:MAG: hypothetical protein EXR39_08310 [Betaproteobacteria bacterium]|nr:hypothetical protein [Betaproteobacteria bacterium]